MVIRCPSRGEAPALCALHALQTERTSSNGQKNVLQSKTGINLALLLQQVELNFG